MLVRRALLRRLASCNQHHRRRAQSSAVSAAGDVQSASGRLSELRERLATDPPGLPGSTAPEDDEDFPQPVVVVSAVDPLDAEELVSDAASLLDRTFYIETRGCQMNVSDSEVVRAILVKAGLREVQDADESWVTLLNTCAIREKAEAKVWGRLHELRQKTKASKIAVLGCMAERIKEELFEKKLVDLVAGPDAYRELPALLRGVLGIGETRISTQLSLEETYAEIAPVRANPETKHGAFVSIQRGCDNMCSYCIVPFVRGRERSRSVESVMRECAALCESGVREITLLGQNVNSYSSLSDEGSKKSYSVGFDSPFIQNKRKDDREACRFAELISMVAEAHPECLVRFTSPHPKDFPDALLEAVASYDNIASQLHLPAQSGSNTVLETMRRGYTVEAYLALCERAREKIPGVALSSDFIAGFCGETHEDHLATLRLLESVKYDMAFLYAYSSRPRTNAARKLEDDVPKVVKFERLNELVLSFNNGRAERAREAVGETRLVLIEGTPRRQPNFSNEPHFVGRDYAHRKVIFTEDLDLKFGDFAHVLVEQTNGASLFGRAVAKADGASGRLLVV